MASKRARMTETLLSAFTGHAARHPEKVLWRHISAGQAEDFTFARIQARARAFAAAYTTMSVQPAETVLISLPHHPDALAAFIGAVMVGAVPCFLGHPSPRQPAHIFWPAHADLLSRFGTPLLVTTAAAAVQAVAHSLVPLLLGPLAVESVDAAAAFLPNPAARPPDPSAPAVLHLSAGVTGRKKILPLTNAAIRHQVRAYAAYLGIESADTWVNGLPLQHETGLFAGVLAPLILGGTVTTLGLTEWVARPALLLEALHQYQGRFVWLPNFAFELLAQAVPRTYTADLSHVKAVISTGEPCKSGSLARFEKRFAACGIGAGQLAHCYAVAENVFAVSQTRLGALPGVVRLQSETLHRHGRAVDVPPETPGSQIVSAGTPMPGMSVQILTEAGITEADDIVGEITLSGPSVLERYINDPRATFERFADGRFRTGDYGFMRLGELYVIGRKDEQAVISGTRLPLADVERVINDVPGIRPWCNAAFGVFNRRTGTEDLVVVVEHDAATDADSEDIARAMREAVFGHTGIEISVLRLVEPGWLLRAGAGRVARRASRNKYVREEASALPPPPQAASAADVILESSSGADTFQRLAAIIAEHFKFPAGRLLLTTVPGDVPGWNSLAHTTLMLELEAAFRVSFDDADMFNFLSVSDLVTRVEALQAAQSPDRPDRIIHRTPAASIVRFAGSKRATSDAVIFAGLAMKMGGNLDIMDFASVLAKTDMRGHAKYFVTDRQKGYFADCIDEVSSALNEESDRPKTLIGNSMGGLGALIFAQRLANVRAVLTFVPRTHLPPTLVRPTGAPPLPPLRFRPGVEYCILFGEGEDRGDVEFLRGLIDDPERQKLLIVRNCGHNLVRYLNQENLLEPVLSCAARPASMADEIAAIVGTLPADPALLRDLVAVDEDG
jgi:acyl-CoA synthetase (AMP-forming)/AMP-acid ligase II/acyl carrier protein